MEYLGGGQVRYRLAFQDAPWLDSNDFTSNRLFAVGDLILVDEGAGSSASWSIADVLQESEGVPDTLVLLRV